MSDIEHEGDDGPAAVAVDDHPSDAPSPESGSSAVDRLALPRATALEGGARRAQVAGALVVGLVLSVLVCGVLAWQQRGDEPSAAGQRAAVRDQAREATLRDIETLMSADHRDARGTFDDWSAVTTGRLNAQLVSQQKAIVKRLRATKEVTTVRTVEAALSSWDEAAGTARLLAVLELRTTSTKDPATRTVRYLAMAQRVEGDWLLSAVQQIGGVS